LRIFIYFSSRPKNVRATSSALASRMGPFAVNAEEGFFVPAKLSWPRSFIVGREDARIFRERVDRLAIATSHR
jgi:hypothetical protein